MKLRRISFPYRAFGSSDVRIVRNLLSTAIIWGMIPLALAGAMPSTACICANGDVKLFCSHRAAERAPTGHACCEHGREAAVGSAPAHHDCCNTEDDGEGVGAIPCHCTPVFVAPATRPIVASVAVDFELTAEAHTPAIEPLPPISHPAAAFVAHETGPPVDLTVTFGRLLI